MKLINLHTNMKLGVGLSPNNEVMVAV